MDRGSFAGQIMQEEYRQVSPSDIDAHKEMYRGGWELFTEYLPSFTSDICMLSDVECVIFGERRAIRLYTIQVTRDEFAPEHLMTDERLTKFMNKPAEKDIELFMSHLPYAVQVYYAKKRLAELIAYRQFEEGFRDFVVAYQFLEYGHASLREEFEILIAYSPQPSKPYNYPITVYRGETDASTPYTEAISWTTSPKVAKKFARRYQKHGGRVVVGEILEGTVFYEVGNDLHKEYEILVDGSEVSIKDIVDVEDLE